MKSLIVTSILICLLLSDRAKRGWNLTEEEDEDLDRQLRAINKPAIKIIENENGDIIDCVPFEKQTSLDHLSSKNQGWNISHPNASNEVYVPSLTISKVPLKGARCPQGSIPIRRTTKEDLVRSKLSSKFGLAYFPVASPQVFPSAPGVHWAVLVSDRGSYKGANAVLQVYGLSQVEMNQCSGTTITIFSGIDGPPDNFNAISVGWLVHPSLYGDRLPRFTVFWTTDGYQGANCFNFQCPGFIQKSTNYFPGMSLQSGGSLPLAIYKVHPSLYGDHLPRFTVFWTTDGYQSANCFNFHCPGFIQKSTNYFPGMSLQSGGSSPLAIYKDEPTGGWCISTLKGKAEEIIGCWPGSIFSSLQGTAEFIEWGGTVASPTEQASPPMGNGQWPWDNGAFISRIHMIDEQLKQADPTGRLIADKPRCYNVFGFEKRGANGWSFYFGGPGRCTG